MCEITSLGYDLNHPTKSLGRVRLGLFIIPLSPHMYVRFD